VTKVSILLIADSITLGLLLTVLTMLPFIVHTHLRAVEVSVCQAKYAKTTATHSLQIVWGMMPLISVQMAA
jgi:hypothetical protein